MSKIPLTLSLDEEVVKEFKKMCIDKKTTDNQIDASSETQRLMENELEKFKKKGDANVKKQENTAPHRAGKAQH